MRRRTATRVKDGRVQKKNNWAPARDDYRALPQGVFESLLPAYGRDFGL